MKKQAIIAMLGILVLFGLVTFQEQYQAKQRAIQEAQAKQAEQIQLANQARMKKLLAMRQGKTDSKNNAKLSPGLVKFSVAHATSSPVNTVPLKNTKINIQVYYYGNPRGQLAVKTDDDQSFVIGKFKAPEGVAVEILSVENEGDYAAHCKGYVTPGKTEITMQCKSTDKRI